MFQICLINVPNVDREKTIDFPTIPCQKRLISTKTTLIQIFSSFVYFLYFELIYHNIKFIFMPMKCIQHTVMYLLTFCFAIAYC